MEEKLQKSESASPETAKKGISGGMLKWIAVITMFIDHCTAVFFLTWYWPMRRAARIYPSVTASANRLYWVLRGVGRIAFPIYCFLLVEGFFHTRDVKKYLGRLLLFGVISDPFFDRALFSGSGWISWAHQNVYFTLFLGLLAIWMMDMLIRKGFSQATPLLQVLRILGAAAAAAACVAAAEYGNTDYGGGGVLVILCLYLFRRWELIRAGTAGAALLRAGKIEMAGWPAFLLFHFYNGQRGKQPKYFFYLFYPAHLALLCLARWLLNRAGISF